MPQIPAVTSQYQFCFQSKCIQGQLCIWVKMKPRRPQVLSAQPLWSAQSFQLEYSRHSATESQMLHQWIWAKIYLFFFPHAFYCLWPHKCWFYHVLSPPWWFGTRILSISYIKVCINYRRKFRSQTSDNMDRWKAEQGRGREKRKIRREKIREEKESEERRCRCAKR